MFITINYQIVPPEDHFFVEHIGQMIDLNTDTLDVHGGQDDLGFDKRGSIYVKTLRMVNASSDEYRISAKTIETY